MLKLAGEFIEGQLADHMAELDAHMAASFQKVKTGEYMLPMGMHIATTSAAMVANRLNACCPILVARDMTLDRLAIKVITAGAAGTKARLGIYANGTNLYPGALVLDAGEVAVDTTGIKTIAINQALTKGLHWMAYVSDGTPTLILASRFPTPLGIESGGLIYPLHFWRVTYTYATLPDPFTAGGVVNSEVAPAVYGRVSSLD